LKSRNGTAAGRSGFRLLHGMGGRQIRMHAEQTGHVGASLADAAEGA